MTDYFELKNNASSRLVSSITDSAVTITVTAGEGVKFPATGVFQLTLWDDVNHPDPGEDIDHEIVWGTNTTGDVITIVRGKESTSGFAHLSGARVAMLITAGTFDDPSYGMKQLACAETVNINLPAEASYTPATNPATLVEVAGSTTYAGWSYLAFDDNVPETTIWAVKLPGYNGGNIIVNADIKPATTPDGTPDPVTVAFDILTIGIASGEEFDAAVLTDAANGASPIDMSIALSAVNANTETVEGSVTINPDNVASGDILKIALRRNPTAEDATNDHLEGDVHLLGVTLEYTRA